MVNVDLHSALSRSLL